MTCYLLFYAPMKKLVPRGSGRPLNGGSEGLTLSSLSSSFSVDLPTPVFSCNRNTNLGCVVGELLLE